MSGTELLAAYEPEIRSLVRNISPTGRDYLGLDPDDYANRLRYAAWRASKRRLDPRYIRTALHNELRTLHRQSVTRRRYESAVFPAAPETYDPQGRYEAASDLSRLADSPEGATLLQFTLSGHKQAFPDHQLTPQALRARLYRMRTKAREKIME